MAPGSRHAGVKRLLLDHAPVPLTLMTAEELGGEGRGGVSSEEAEAYLEAGQAGMEVADGAFGGLARTGEGQEEEENEQAGEEEEAEEEEEEDLFAAMM